MVPPVAGIVVLARVLSPARSSVEPSPVTGGKLGAESACTVWDVGGTTYAERKRRFSSVGVPAVLFGSMLRIAIGLDHPRRGLAEYNGVGLGQIERHAPAGFLGLSKMHKQGHGT